MLRYLSYGPRNFTSPVGVIERLNWEFYAILDGVCAPVFPSGPPLPMKTRRLWGFRPRVRYGWRGRGKGVRAAFHFPSVPPELDQALGEDPYLSVDLEEHEARRVADLACSLKQHYEKPHQYSHLASDAALLELSLILLKDFSKNNQIPLHLLDAGRVDRALTWYAIHMEENPTVEAVAAATSVSAGHLRRTFKSVKGKSPHAVFREVQIKRACDLLTTTSDTLDRIGIQCGFQSVTDFIRVFQSSMGTSPNTWRRKITPHGV